MLIDDMLSTGHARALLAIDDPDEQYNLAQKIFDEKLSVREVEKLVKNLGKPKKQLTVKDYDKTLQAIYEEVQENLKVKLGTKVTITGKGNGAGKLEIEFYNHEDLERLLDLIGNQKQ